jgi:hypothetical protein
MSRPPIAWSRMFVEGVVIVVSILLAFAIDAWWDDRQRAEESRLQVERVVAELEANIARLDFQIERLEVRHELSDLLSDQDVSEKTSVELRGLRPAIEHHVGRLVPGLDTAIRHPLMADYSPSRFPYDATVLFSDMYLESLIGGVAIRMEINATRGL